MPLENLSIRLHIKDTVNKLLHVICIFFQYKLTACCLLFHRFLHVCAEFSEEALPPAVLYGVYKLRNPLLLLCSPLLTLTPILSYCFLLAVPLRRFWNVIVGSAVAVVEVRLKLKKRLLCSALLLSYTVLHND